VGRRTTLAGAVALALTVLGAWVLRIPRGAGAGALNLDVDLYFYPLYEATYRRIAAGALPTWNPYQLCGIPWLATLQAGVFYPFHALYLVLPLHLGLATSHAIHLPLAALAMIAFARRAGLALPAAVLAALLFTIRGMLALSLAAPNYVEAVAWLPLGALGVWELAGERPAGGMALLATATAMSFLAGYPQPTAYMLYTWATLVVAALIAARAVPARSVATAARFAGAVGTGTLAAGVQLLPALELVRDGAHRAISTEAMSPFGLSPAAAILASSAIAGSAFSWGVTALGLAAIAVLNRRARTLAVWALVMTAATMVLSLGDTTPLGRVYRALPFLGSFRFPDRLLGMTDFVLAIAAAVGFDAVAERAAGPRDDRGPVLAALVAVAGVAMLAQVWGAPEAARATVVACALVAGAFLVATARADARTARAWAAGLVAVAAAEALLAPWRLLVTYSPRTVERYGALAPEYRAVAARAGTDRAWFASGVANLQPEHALKLAMRYGVRTIDDYEPLAPRRQAEYFTFFGEGAPVYRRPPWLFAGEVTTLAPPPGVAPPASRRRLLDLAALRFVVVPAGARAVRPDLDAFLRDGGFEPRPLDSTALALFENPHALPRAFVVYRTRPAPEPSALLADLATSDFDPLAASYVEGAPPFEPAADAPARGAPAHVVVDDETAVELEATLARPGLVVLADAYYPGWRATVDGQAASIVATNHLYRGVAAPSGTHTIRFEYRPTSLIAGAIASIAGWLAIPALALAARRSRRQTTAER
jgi:hypothetical protein